MIRVCIVEDQTLVREGIRSLLGLVDDVEVVGEATDGETALKIIAETRPDVVLLDWYLPRLNGLEVLTRLSAAKRLPPTLILTTFGDDRIVLDGIEAGARGFLLKDVSLERLTSAIRTLASGGSAIDPALTERLLHHSEAMECAFSSLEPPEPLTERELEVLRLMAAGHSNREIAGLLGVTEGTVKNHVSNILSKMGVRDRTRAVLKALEAGLLSRPAK